MDMTGKEYKIMDCNENSALLLTFEQVKIILHNGKIS